MNYSYSSAKCPTAVAVRLALALLLVLLLGSTAVPRARAATTLVVTKTADTDDGSCDAADCSLREAVALANNGSGPYTITFGISAVDPGCESAMFWEYPYYYVCTLPLGNRFVSSIDPLLIQPLGPAGQPPSSVTITGEGATAAGSRSRIILDGSASGRLFAVAEEGSLTLRKLTLSGATDTAVFVEGSLAVNKTLFSDNSSPGDGGAVHVAATGSAGFSNTTFYGNHAAGRGGALYAPASLNGMSFSTLARNSAAEGAAIYGGVELANSLLEQGNSGANCAASPTHTVVDLGGNISDDTSCALSATSSLNGVDPLLGALGYAGGPTLVVGLSPASPAISAAVGCPPPATDQRDVARPQGMGCDSGAYESGPSVVNTTASVGISNGCDPLVPGVADCTLREALGGGLPGEGTVTFEIPAADPGCTAFNECTIAPSDDPINIYDVPAGSQSIDGSGARITLQGSFVVRMQGNFYLRNLTFSGAILGSDGMLHINNSTFLNTRLSIGSCDLGSGSLGVTNSTFYSDEGSTRPVIHSYCGSVGISNSTFYGDNTAIETESASLRNVILAGTGAANCVEIEDGEEHAFINDLGGNISDDASCRFTAVSSRNSTDPLLATVLADRGGSTLTLPLLPGSPAIDTAAACPPPTIDQRGVARPQGPACDSGAYEYDSQAHVSGTVILQTGAAAGPGGTVTLTDLDGVFAPLTVPVDAATGSFNFASLPVRPVGSVFTLRAAHSMYLSNEWAPFYLDPGSGPALDPTMLKGGDANNDGIIDILDLGCMGGAYLTPGSSCGGQGGTDINADGITDIRDLALAGGNYNLTAPQPW